jgi:hypothetical protein
MSLLLVEQSGRRTPITLNGKLVIGRGSACKLRIDHPLVSRDHAIIEQSPQGYTIRDTGSRNGTKLNNAPVKAPVLLQDGDRIDIGPTILWFRSSEQDPHVETLPKVNADEGIVFECECTARLWAPMTLAGATVRCRHCNRDVTCPTIFTPIEAKHVTEVSDCAICLSKVTTDDEQHVCESCGAVYHVECWTDNCGCAVYGCKQVNVLSSDHHVTGTAEPIAEELEDLPEPAGKVPWDAALIGAATVGTILGLFCFGGTALLVALFSMWYLLRRRTVWVWGALFLSLVGFIAGVMVSGLWWLNILPIEWFTR